MGKKKQLTAAEIAAQNARAGQTIQTIMDFIPKTYTDIKYNLVDNDIVPARNNDNLASYRIDGDITSADILLKKLLEANNEISGKTNVNWSGEKVAIKADLMASEFNVNDVIPNNKQAFAIPSLISNANALTFVPNNVADFSFLNAVNAEANVKIGNLILPQKTELKDVDAKAKLQNGLLNVNPFSFDVGGGKVSGKASLSALSNSINLDMKTENLKLQDISHLGVGKKSLLKVEQGGDLMIDLSISTLGNTYRKMSDNLKQIIKEREAYEAMATRYEKTIHHFIDFSIFFHSF